MGKPVFISYSRDNSPVASRLRHDLKRAGLEPWQDVFDIPTDAQWEERVLGGIAACDAFVLLESPEAADPKRYVLKELAEAKRLGKKIVRMRVSGQDGQMPAEWQARQTIDARGRYWESLSKAIADLGGAPVLGPLDWLEPGASLADFAAQFGGERHFRAGGQTFLAVPVLPSAHGMTWLAGPAREAVPVKVNATLPRVGVLVRVTGKEADDALQEVCGFRLAAGMPPWVFYVEGPKADGQHVLPNDRDYVWRDIVTLTERTIQEWVKGRHAGIDVFQQGPVTLGFVLGMKLREMVRYDVYNYSRGSDPPYARVYSGP